jgi:hypothetical protein
MPTKGDRLRERFPDELVKQRPGSALFAHRDACPGKACRETRDASKHMQFSYVEDEAVMTRLDDVLGLGGWQWKVEAVGADVVKGHLMVQWEPGAEWTTFQDFGYCGNGASGEPLKEAMTDAFRRCGRLIGIARYIYAGEVGASAPTSRPSPAARPAPSFQAQQREADEPDFGEEPPPFDALPGIAAGIFDAPVAGVCPVHGQPWRLVPAGVSKRTGEPYDAFHACPERGCRAKPAAEWIERHMT